MIDIAKYSLLLLAVFMLTGGFMGYALAKSRISLISGVVSFILLTISYFVSQQNFKLGVGIGLVVVVVLDVTFVVRLVKSKKVMPAAPLLFLCGLETAFLLYAF